MHHAQNTPVSFYDCFATSPPPETHVNCTVRSPTPDAHAHSAPNMRPQLALPLPPRGTSHPPRGVIFVVERLGRFHRVVTHSRGERLLPLVDRVVRVYCEESVRVPFDVVVGAGVGVRGVAWVRVVDAAACRIVKDLEACVGMVVGIGVRAGWADGGVTAVEEGVKIAFGDRWFGVRCERVRILGVLGGGGVEGAVDRMVEEEEAAAEAWLAADVVRTVIREEKERSGGRGGGRRPRVPPASPADFEGDARVPLMLPALVAAAFEKEASGVVAEGKLPTPHRRNGERGLGPYGTSADIMRTGPHVGEFDPWMIGEKGMARDNTLGDTVDAVAAMSLLDARGANKVADSYDRLDAIRDVQLPPFRAGMLAEDEYGTTMPSENIFDDDGSAALRAGEPLETGGRGKLLNDGCMPEVPQGASTLQGIPHEQMPKLTEDGVCDTARDYVSEMPRGMLNHGVQEQIPDTKQDLARENSLEQMLDEMQDPPPEIPLSQMPEETQDSSREIAQDLIHESLESSRKNKYGIPLDPGTMAKQGTMYKAQRNQGKAMAQETIYATPQQNLPAMAQEVTYAAPQQRVPEMTQGAMQRAQRHKLPEMAQEAVYYAHQQQVPRMAQDGTYGARRQQMSDMAQNAMYQAQQQVPEAVQGATNHSPEHQLPQMGSEAIYHPAKQRMPEMTRHAIYDPPQHHVPNMTQESMHHPPEQYAQKGAQETMYYSPGQRMAEMEQEAFSAPHKYMPHVTQEYVKGVPREVSWDTMSQDRTMGIAQEHARDWANDPVLDLEQELAREMQGEQPHEAAIYHHDEDALDRVPQRSDNDKWMNQDEMELRVREDQEEEEEENSNVQANFLGNLSWRPNKEEQLLLERLEHKRRGKLMVALDNLQKEHSVVASDSDDAPEEALAEEDFGHQWHSSMSSEELSSESEADSGVESRRYRGTPVAVRVPRHHHHPPTRSRSKHHHHRRAAEAEAWRHQHREEPSRRHTRRQEESDENDSGEEIDEEKYILTEERRDKHEHTKQRRHRRHFEPIWKAPAREERKPSSRRKRSGSKSGDEDGVSTVCSHRSHRSDGRERHATKSGSGTESKGEKSERKKSSGSSRAAETHGAEKVSSSARVGKKGSSGGSSKRSKSRGGLERREVEVRKKSKSRRRAAQPQCATLPHSGSSSSVAAYSKPIYRHRVPMYESGPEDPIPWYCEGQSAPEDSEGENEGCVHMANASDSEDQRTMCSTCAISESAYSSYGRRDRNGRRYRSQHGRSVTFGEDEWYYGV